MPATLPKVKGTIQLRGLYQARLRVPQEIRDQWDGKSVFQKSLKTSDPRVAEKEVRALKTIMDAQVEKAKADQGIKALARNLPWDQRTLFESSGGLDGLAKDFHTGKIRVSLLSASEVDRPPEFDVEDGPNGAPQKIHVGADDVDEEELAADRAADKAKAEEVKAQTNARGRVLRTLGQDVQLIGDVFSLRDVVEKWAPTVDPQTANAARYYIRRFTELHGEVPLTDLNRAHLRDFLEQIKGLPKVHSAKVRDGVRVIDLTLREATEWTRHNQQETISDRTRDKYLSILKRLMRFSVEQGYRSDDPWASYKFPKEKQKHSARKRDERRSFTKEEVRAILDYVSESHEPQFGDSTIDFWAPWIGAYHGARIQEICQLRLCDFEEFDGIWSMHITDEGEDMRAKSASSVRWVPVHPKLIEAGLRSHVERRREGCAVQDLAFEQWGRLKRKMEPLSQDSRGRVSGAYGKRFGRMLRAKLEITDPRAVFHSFRHRLQDAADNVGIPDSHRRYLTGRSNRDTTEAGYGEGAAMRFLYGSLCRIDPLA